MGRGGGGPGAAPQKPPTEDGVDLSENKYNEWSGYEGSLFANTVYDEEDREADSVFVKVDNYIDGRRRQKREEKMNETLERLKQEKPSHSSLFSDLKR